MAKEEPIVGSENSSIRKKLIFIVGLVIFLALSYYFIFKVHILEETVYHYSSITGNLDFPLSYEIFMKNPDIRNDYFMEVSYESKGAFLAGREISVSVDFTAVNNIDRLRNSELMVVFPGALNFPIPNDWRRLTDASIELRFINDSSNHALGKGKIIYYMPDYYSESVIEFRTANSGWQILPAISNDTRYTYILIIQGKQQKAENAVTKNRFLSIAPLETYLQLKINNLIIFLTIIAVFIALIEIMYKVEK